MAGLITPELRARVGRPEPPMRVEVTRREIVKYAIATEQVLEKYLRGDEAPPMFLFGLFRPVVPLEELREDGLPASVQMPDLPLKRTMAGGTEVRLHRAIRAGETLVGTRTLVDMYEKEGRSGPLIFLVYELAIRTEAGEPVAEEIQTRIAR